MPVSLTWEGPVGPGNFPDDALLFERLCQPGVYLRIKTYDNDRLVAYAGQSVSLLSRFDQHLTAMLSLAAPLRDATGATAFSGDGGARLEAYGRLSEMSRLASEDAGRVRFWFALCDDYFHSEHLNAVEALLQQRLVERLAGKPADVENAIAAPGGWPEDIPDIWEHDFSGLDDEGCRVLGRVLGDAAMTVEGRTHDAA